MKVGDLVGLPVSAETTLLALVIKSGPCGGTFIKWFDDGTVENVNNYVVEEFEVISEGR
jgi:hypothetical protein